MRRAHRRITDVRDLRALDLEPIASSLRVPRQGPARSVAAKGKGDGAKGGGRQGGGGGARGAGVGVGATVDPDREPSR